MARRQIVISTEDHQRLEALLASDVTRLVSAPDRLDELQAELDRAEMLLSDEVPEDVVTMNSTVTLRDLDTDEIETYTLVYPDRADIANQQLSILAPVGTAILGYRAGDEIKWRVPAGWRRLKIEHVICRSKREQLVAV
jgi:regulator of nucleoside diphosphate kinase